MISDIGRVHGLDQLPVKFTASSFSKYTSGILDHHHDSKDSSIFPVDANDTCLNSLSSYSEHPCKQDWESLCDFSQELWSSVSNLMVVVWGLSLVSRRMEVFAMILKMTKI